MTALEASKSTNARADGFAARDGKTACSSTSPMSQSARTRTSRPCEISFLAAPTSVETSPSPAAAADPTSLKVTTRRSFTVTEVAFLLVNNHERPSLDGRCKARQYRPHREQPTELHQVRYFLAVASTLNFTRAAEQCNITQPALTK